MLQREFPVGALPAVWVFQLSHACQGPGWSNGQEMHIVLLQSFQLMILLPLQLMILLPYPRTEITATCVGHVEP